MNRDTFYPSLPPFPLQHPIQTSDLRDCRKLPAYMNTGNATDNEVDLVSINTQIATETAHHNYIASLQASTRENYTSRRRNET